MKIKNVFADKKIRLIAIYTVMLFCLVNTTIYKESKAKYFKEVDRALTYQNELYNLHNSPNISIAFNENGSNYDTIRITVTFERNDITKENETDYYELITSKACTISSGKTREYTGPKTDNQTVQYRLECAVAQIVENNLITLPITINEHVNDEDEFQYYSGKKTYISLNEYYLKFQQAATEKEIPKDVKFYDELIKFLNNNYFPHYVESKFTNDTQIKQAILDYVKVFDVDNNKVLEIANNFKGLKITDNDNSFKVEVMPNFIGYGYTYSSNKKNEMYMYFSKYQEDNTILMEVYKEAFKYYLNNYYSFNNEQIEIINDYISYLIDKNSDTNLIANFVLNGTPTIPGVERIPIDDNYLYRLEIKSLYAIANNYRKSPIVIPISDRGKMLTILNDSLKFLIGDSGVYKDIISQSSVDTITRYPIFLSFIKNYIENDIMVANKFSNYFILYDAQFNHYVMIRAYSDGIENTYGSIDKLNLTLDNSLLTGLNISIVNTNDNTLTITLKADKNIITDDIDNVIYKTVEDLDTYFKQFFEVKSINLENGIYTMTDNSSIKDSEDSQYRELTYTISHNEMAS